MSIKTTLVAALTASIVALSLPGAAEAGHRRHHHRNDAGVAAAIGLGVGVIVGSAFSQRPNYDRYDDRYDRPVSYRHGPRPWTGEWHRYCGYKYRSFNHRTGYFLGFDGRYHFCR
jgi:hypothetical protein